MIKTLEIELSELPYVKWKELNKLPEIQSIYFIYFGEIVEILKLNVHSVRYVSHHSCKV